MSPGKGRELARGAALVPEKAFQQAVLDYARLMGWMVYHTHDSRHSAAGFPDLVMVRQGRMVVAELKRVGGKPTAEQAAWLAEMGAVAGCDSYSWTPVSWDEIEGVLR